MSWLARLLGGGIVRQVTAALLEAHRLRLEAQTDREKLEMDQQIARLEAARDIALTEAADRWSATRLGRLLIVVPFGLWWASVFAVSMLNPLLGLDLAIHDIPPRFWDSAAILIPAITLGDAGALVARRWRR